MQSKHSEVFHSLRRCRAPRGPRRGPGREPPTPASGAAAGGRRVPRGGGMETVRHGVCGPFSHSAWPAVGQGDPVWAPICPEASQRQPPAHTGFHGLWGPVGVLGHTVMHRQGRFPPAGSNGLPVCPALPTEWPGTSPAWRLGSTSGLEGGTRAGGRLKDILKYVF